MGGVGRTFSCMPISVWVCYTNIAIAQQCRVCALESSRIVPTPTTCRVSWPGIFSCWRRCERDGVYSLLFGGPGIFGVTSVCPGSRMRSGFPDFVSLTAMGGKWTGQKPSLVECLLGGKEQSWLRDTTLAQMEYTFSTKFLEIA